MTKAQRAAARDHQIVEQLQAAMPQESLLKIDLAIADREAIPRLLVAVSCKWSLRTDRAQDCISQGNKLASLRRGHMPHFAVLTMEPRPAMLKLIAYGSGAVDCVYHVALDELRAAAEKLAATKGTPAARSQQNTLELMIEQGRIRPYGDLQTEVRKLAR